MNCKKATHLCSESQERALTRLEYFSLKLHILMCFSCRRFGKQIAMLRAVSREYAKGGSEEYSVKREQSEE